MAEFYLFGSLVTGAAHEGSGMNLAVRDDPPGAFFRAYGEFLAALCHDVDLIDIDTHASCP